MAHVRNDVEEIEADEVDANIWGAKNEAILINLMEEEVIKGNRSTITFTKVSWKRILEQLCAQTKRSYNDKQLKNKYNQLRQRQKHFKKLIEHTGIGYNAVTGKVTATDAVWEEIFKVQKQARMFKRKGCLLYEKLCTIFGYTTASGSNAHPSTMSPSDSDEDDVDPPFEPNQEKEHLDESDDANSTHMPRGRKHPTPSGSSQRKRANAAASMSSALLAFTENYRRKVDILAASTSSANFVKESMKALNEIEGVDGPTYAKLLKNLARMRCLDKCLWRCRRVEEKIGFLI